MMISLVPSNTLLELMCCLVLFVLGKVVPDAVEALLYDASSIVVPYQALDDGNVVLDLQYNQELVQYETVNDVWRIIICDVLALAVLWLSSYLFYGKKELLVSDLCSITCVWLMGCGFTVCFTNSIKFYTSQKRPNFYAMCEFNVDTLACEGSRDDVMNAQRSFPSGHASLAFSSMTVVSLYWVGNVYQKVHASWLTSSQEAQQPQESSFFRQRALSMPYKLLVLVACSPMLVAVWIASSRVHDLYHFPCDVLAGALLGSACSYFSYRLWYPSVHSPLAGYPLQQHDVVLTELLQEKAANTNNRNDYMEFS